MLQIFRDKSQGYLTWIIVLFIAAVFALWGLSDYFTTAGDQSTAIKVNGEKISWRSVDALYERMLRQYEGQVNEKILKEQARLSLAQHTVLVSTLKVLGLRVNDELTAKALVQIPAFQVDGQFSKDHYLKVLAGASYTDADFRQELAQKILLNQLEKGLVSSGFILPGELNTTVALWDQKRDFGYVNISPQHYAEQIKISMEESQKYYEGHKSSFIKPETVNLEYVELSVGDLSKQVPVTLQEAEAFYNEHKAVYNAPERVHARHILIIAPSNNPELDAKAKAKATQALKEITEGKEFSTVATLISEDPGSAGKGGDLGWFMRGQMVPEFEKAAFSLKKPGEVTGLVRSQFGYHLIQLVEHKNEETRTFAEVKALVEEQLKQEKAQRLFVEKNEELAKLAFENAGSLKPISEKLGLKIKETGFFGKTEQQQEGIAENPNVVKVAFTDEIIKKGMNSEPIKLEEGKSIVVHLKKHMPAEQQTFEQVKEKIQKQLVVERSKEKAKEMSESILARLKKGENPVELAKAEKLTWVSKKEVSRKTKEIDATLVSLAFKLPQKEELTAQTFTLPSGEYGVIMITKISPADITKIDPETQKTYRQNLTELSGQLEYALFATQALGEAKVEFARDPRQ